MKRSVNISAALLLTLAAFGCTKKNTGMNNDATPDPQTQTVPDATVPGVTTPGTTDSTTGTTMGQPVPSTNCPDPSMPGYDASRMDPACPRPGTDATVPTTPTDPTQPMHP